MGLGVLFVYSFILFLVCLFLFSSSFIFGGGGGCLFIPSFVVVVVAVVAFFLPYLFVFLSIFFILVFLSFLLFVSLFSSLSVSSFVQNERTVTTGDRRLPDGQQRQHGGDGGRGTGGRQQDGVPPAFPGQGPALPQRLGPAARARPAARRHQPPWGRPSDGRGGPGPPGLRCHVGHRPGPQRHAHPPRRPR